MDRAVVLAEFFSLLSLPPSLLLSAIKAPRKKKKKQNFFSLFSLSLSLSLPFGFRVLAFKRSLFPSFLSSFSRRYKWEEED